MPFKMPPPPPPEKNPSYALFFCLGVGGGVGGGPMFHVEFERSHVSCDYLLIPCHH